MRIFGLLLLVHLHAWSFTPIHQEVQDSPLLYLRVPILWDRPELSQTQKTHLTTALLQSLTKPGKAGYAQRQALSLLKGSIEVMALPPENKFLPMPGLALRASFSGSQDEMAKRLQNLIIACVEDFQGTPANWLKFKRSVDKGVITDSAFLLGRITLMTERDRFTLLFSQSNPSFPEKFKAKAKQNIEAGQASQEKDFAMHIDIGSSYSYYKEWLQRFAKPQLMSLSQAGLIDLQTLKLWSEGDGQSFRLKGKVDLGTNTKGKWNLLSSAQKANVQYPSAGEFKGSLLWPSLSATDWYHCFEVLSFVPIKERKKYAELFKIVSGPLAFSWSETSIAPVISIMLSDAKAFEATLSKIMAPKGRIAKESGTNLRHILWEQNSVSYMIEGKKLTFSPLIQSLRDLRSNGETTTQSELIRVEYPLAGSLSGNYYTLMNLSLQGIVSTGAALDPKVFPPFSQLNVKERSWVGEGSFELFRNKQVLEMVWNQPFGLPGLVGGVKLPSSSWLNFLSLAYLTSNSIDIKL
jgi:hypothetical protein